MSKRKHTKKAPSGEKIELVEDVWIHILSFWHRLVFHFGTEYVFGLYRWVFLLWRGDSLREYRQRMFLDKVVHIIKQMPYIKCTQPYYRGLIALHPKVEKVWIPHNYDISFLPELHALKQLVVEWPGTRGFESYGVVLPALSHSLESVIISQSPYDAERALGSFPFGLMKNLRAITVNARHYVFKPGAFHNCTRLHSQLKRLSISRAVEQPFPLAVSGATELTQLEVLEVHDVVNYVRGDLLYFVDSLRELSCNINPRAGISILDIGAMVHLRRLNLFQTDTGAMHTFSQGALRTLFCNLNLLEELEIHDCPSLRDYHLYPLTQLMSLSLHCCDDPELQGAFLTVMPALHKLEIRLCGLSNSRYIKDVAPQLSEFTFDEDYAGSQAIVLVNICQMTRLSTLSITMKNQSVSYYSKMPITLRSLSLASDSSVLDKQITHLTNLTTLNLNNNNKIKPETIYHFTLLQKLSFFNSTLSSERFVDCHYKPNRRHVWPFLHTLER